MRFPMKMRGHHTGRRPVPIWQAEPSTSSMSSTRVTLAANAVLGVLLFCLAACSSDATPAPAQACVEGERVLNAGFYAFFEPVSYSAESDPASPGFNTHLGYEADLLTALEAMKDSGLSFSRQGIGDWPGIWLQSAGPDYDIVGGGITILDSRTRDASGERVITFTSGHITFRQSLLIRAEDTERIVSHDDLTSDMGVGAVADTTGEFRLLELTGLVDAAGTLAAGVRVDTPRGTVVADGSANYSITPAGDSPNVEGRSHLYPPSETMPQVVYFRDDEGLLDALASGRIDAVGRGEIGNRYVAVAPGDAYRVTALDAQTETGGFTLAAADGELAACLNERLNWLTDDRRIGYGAWLDDPAVFMDRAETWNDRMH